MEWVQTPNSSILQNKARMRPKHCSFLITGCTRPDQARLTFAQSSIYLAFMFTDSRQPLSGSMKCAAQANCKRFGRSSLVFRVICIFMLTTFTLVYELLFRISEFSTTVTSVTFNSFHPIAKNWFGIKTSSVRSKVCKTSTCWVFLHNFAADSPELNWDSLDSLAVQFSLSNNLSNSSSVTRL